MKDSELRSSVQPAVILVALDLQNSQPLWKLAFQQAGETGARLVLLHVVPSPSVSTPDAASVPYYDLSGAMQQARAALLPICQAARASNIRCDVVVREGNPALRILEAVRQFHVDRILLGIRNRGRFSKLLLGSVADQVLRSAQLPVMTVGPEAHLDRPTGNRKVVLLATTLGETSRTSAVLACRLARHANARLVMLHVIPDSPRRESEQLLALRELNSLATEICSDNEEHAVEAEVTVAHGHPCERILEAARNHHAEVIVLGPAGSAGIPHLTHDFTVQKVIAHAPCPVLRLAQVQEALSASTPLEVAHAG